MFKLKLFRSARFWGILMLAAAVITSIYLIKPEKAAGMAREADVEVVSVTAPVLLLQVQETPPRFDVPLPESDKMYTERLCDALDIEPPLIYAMMSVESGYQPDAVNDDGDMGLLQLSSDYLDFYANEYGANDLLDPKQNIFCAASLLSAYLDKYPLADALMAYNCGEKRAGKLWKQGIHSTAYTEKVLAVMAEIKADCL